MLLHVVMISRRPLTQPYNKNNITWKELYYTLVTLTTGYKSSCCYVCTCACSCTVSNITLFNPRRYLRDASHHSVIYRHSDLDLSTVAGATCGSSQEAIRRELLQVQDSVIRSAESARLRKRQTSFDSSLVRCWLYAIADNKFVTALEAAGDNPLGVMSTIILTVRGV